jgi:hypothetical protein
LVKIVILKEKWCRVFKEGLCSCQGKKYKFLLLIIADENIRTCIYSNDRVHLFVGRGGEGEEGEGEGERGSKKECPFLTEIENNTKALIVLKIPLWGGSVTVGR